ncbi:hypothetical protein HII13_000815 [Brettanomyces bruxellensis]|nr:hypothetical protein HII13_000815 [Brettanomyces bruxellensis]
MSLFKLFGKKHDSDRQHDAKLSHSAEGSTTVKDLAKSKIAPSGEYFENLDDNSRKSTGQYENKGTRFQKIQPVDDEDTDDDEVQEDKVSGLIILLTLTASISGFMFGYDTGYISSALVSIGGDLGKTLSYGEEEYITAATSLGALIASILSGVLGDYFGRRPILMLSNILFVIGAIVQCAAHSVWMMISGRLVMGFGVGIGSLLAPVFISELAPRKYRGRLVIINCFGTTGGQLVAYAIGAGLSRIKNGWRAAVGISMFPPLLQFLAFLFFLPDTPRFLVMKGRISQAHGILMKIYPDATEEQVNSSIKELQELNRALPGGNVLQRLWYGAKLLHTSGPAFRALFITCGMQALQQFTGFNSLMYFSATIFKAVGFKDSTAVSIIVAATNFIFTVVAFFIIDKVGRRRLMLTSLYGMLAFLVLNSVAFHFLDITFHGSDAIVNSSDSHTWGIVIIIAMIGYVASYAVGCGNVPWQQGEMFPQAVRALGSSYATATNWTGSLVISATFLTMLQNISPTGTFALFAGLTLLSIIFILLFFPELSGMSLEESQKVLTGGFHIRESMKIAKMRKKYGNKVPLSVMEKPESGVEDMA